MFMRRITLYVRSQNLHQNAAAIHRWYKNFSLVAGKFFHTISEEPKLEQPKCQQLCYDHHKIPKAHLVQIISNIRGIYFYITQLNRSCFRIYNIETSLRTLVNIVLVPFYIEVTDITKKQGYILEKIRLRSVLELS